MRLNEIVKDPASLVSMKSCSNSRLKSFGSSGIQIKVWDHFLMRFPISVNITAKIKQFVKN